MARRMMLGHPTRRRLAAGLIAVTTAVAATAMFAFAFRDQRAEAVDGLQPGAPSGDVAIVSLGPEFANRSNRDTVGTFAELIRVLREAGPPAIVIEPDAINLAQDGLAILGVDESQAQFELGIGNFLTAVTASVPGDLDTTDRGPPRLARDIPRSGVAEASLATGFATPIPADLTDRQRTLPLVALGPDDGEIIPSLSFAGVLTADEFEGELRLGAGGVDVAGRSIPTDGRGNLRVNYAEDLLPGGAQVLDAAALIDGELDTTVLEEAIVFIGVTDPLYAQQFPAAAGANGQIPIVHANANAANTILTEAYLDAPSTRDGVLLGLLVGLLVAALVAVLPLWAAPVPVIIALFGLWQLEGVRFDDGRPFDLLLAGAGVLFAGTATAGLRLLAAGRARRRTANLFSRYVPDSVARQLLDEAVTGDQTARVEVATFFCDLRGFTPLAATLTPDQVREVLDLYYEHVTGAVLDAGGTVMQFVGDEVFSIFGAPLPNTGPDEALAVALGLLSSAPELRQTLEDTGLPAVHYGIGLHVGPVVAAHVGTERRRQYAVVGDTVNVGSRLCGQAPADHAVASEAFWRATGEPRAEPMGPLALKGVDRQVEAYDLAPAQVPTP